MSPNDVRRRLRRRADELGLDFQQAIQYYAIERFLFRLSKSDFAGGGNLDPQAGDLAVTELGSYRPGAA